MAQRNPPPPRISGAQLFARYAYPPNVLGYRRPAEHLSLFEYDKSGVTDAGVVELARALQAFASSWPYLELIAGSTGIQNPSDRPVADRPLRYRFSPLPMTAREDR